MIWMVLDSSQMTVKIETSDSGNTKPIRLSGKVRLGLSDTTGALGPPERLMPIAECGKTRNADSKPVDKEYWTRNADSGMREDKSKSISD